LETVYIFNVIRSSRANTKSLELFISVNATVKILQ